MVGKILAFPICKKAVSLYVSFMHDSACNRFIDGLFGFFVSFLIATLLMFIAVFLDMNMTSSLFYKDRVMDEKERQLLIRVQEQQQQLILQQQQQSGVVISTNNSTSDEKKLSTVDDRLMLV
jgi:uncharacterized membrane protein YhiD involved in acid resistance